MAVGAGLAQYAREGHTIAKAVLKAAGPRDEGAAPISLGLAESCPDLRWLEAPELKAKDQRRRRRRRKEGLSEDEEDPGAPEQPLVVPGLGLLDPEGPVIAVAPKVHDRVMFGTGLPPTTRWTLALEAAKAAGAKDPLGTAFAGLQAAKFGQSSGLEEPYMSSGVVELQALLRGAGEGAAEQRALLAQLAATEHGPRHAFDSAAPMQASAALLARHFVGLDVTASGILALEPAWIVESGAVGTHPFGWHVTATRRTDALALSAAPLGPEPFTLKTTMVVFSNDLKVPAQADLVFGDRDGDRYQIICNTREGIYVFHRSGEDGTFEAVADMKEVLIPPGRPVEISVRWQDSTLVITVGGAELAGVVLPQDAMAGSYGFGAHAGSTVMCSGLVFE